MHVGAIILLEEQISDNKAHRKMITKFWFKGKSYQIDAPAGSIAISNLNGRNDFLMVPDPATGILDPMTAIYLPGDELIQAARGGQYGLKLVAVGATQAT